MGFDNPKPELKRPGPRTAPNGRPLGLVGVKAMAEDVQMSERWVREQLKLGIPHYKFGTFVRFDLALAREWLRERYLTSRAPK